MCSSAIAAAQTTGNIEGTITDSSGAPLPGVAVEASSPKMQGVRLTATTREGRYRVPTVPPGTYQVKASLEGFERVESTITVSLDTTATLDLALKLIVKATVTVAGKLPLVDVTSTTTGTNYTSDVIARLPVERNYADIVRSNPGVNSDRGDTQERSLGLTIYGATSVENQWIIDGVNTTNVIKGFQGKALNTEFIEEVEVKSSGYQAEYGGALGGIVNVVTKSGGNQFRGDAFLYYDLKDTRADRIINDSDIVGGMRVTSEYRADYGGDLGGFILKDRLWFFAAYDRVDNPANASRFDPTPLVPTTMLFPRNRTSNLYSGKLTWNITSHANVVATAFADPSRIVGASRVGTTGGDIVNPNPSTWQAKREIGGLDFGLRVNQLLGTGAVVTAQTSRHRDRFELFGTAGGYGVRQRDFTCAGGTPDEPCHAPRTPNSITGGLGFIGGQAQRNTSHRDQYRLDTAVFQGSHEGKIGGEYQRGTTKAITGYTGGQLVDVLNEFGQTYYAHTFFANNPTDLVPGDWINQPYFSNVAFYLQDSWKGVRGWTFNIGLRWDEQDLRNYARQSVIKTDLWQPRLGVVWDPEGKGSAKIYASIGRYFYALPTNLSILAYGATTGATTFNFDPLDTRHDPRVVGHPTPSISVSGQGTPVDSDLRAIYQDELTVGVEKLLDPTFSVGLKGTYRRLGRTIEDRCDLDYNAPENNYRSCAIVNPGSNGRYARGDVPGCNGLEGEYLQCGQDASPTLPARRVYRGIELLARKTFTEKLWLQASYVYSSLRGNYDGFVNEDYGQTIPGLNVDFDSPQLQRNAYGRLFLDRPHVFRLDVSYTTPFLLFGGLGAYAQSGAPLSNVGYSGVQLEPRGRAGRLPTLWEANLNVGYPITLGPTTVTFLAYAFNLFNNQIATETDTFYRIEAPPGYPDTLFDPNVPSDNVTYGKIIARQDPRLIRGAVKISF